MGPFKLFHLGLLLFTYLRMNDTVVHFGTEFHLCQGHWLIHIMKQQCAWI